MKPIVFKQANTTLVRPSTMTPDECSPLPVFSDGQQTISCWNLSFKERIVALFIGKVWMSVRFGGSQPPVWLQCAKTVFKQSGNGQ